MSIKNSNDIIGNRTRDFPTCSAVPQPTAPPRVPIPLSGHSYPFMEVKRPGVKLITHLFLGPRLRLSRVMFVFPCPHPATFTPSGCGQGQL
jgi:hypothetical protein